MKNCISTTEVNKIITHPGIFHADDVCAVAYLTTLIPAPVERRNPTPEELADPSILIVDVGGQHDVRLRNFDHHQKGGAGARWDSEVPYAAFGLVTDTFCHTDNLVQARFEEKIVMPVDAADCGWGTREGTRPELSFSAVIAGFNPGPGATSVERDAAFRKAVLFAQEVLGNTMREAEEFVGAKKAVLAAHAAKGLMTLESFVPWAEHIFARPDQSEILYVAYPSERGGWCVQQVPVAPGSFEGRKPFPESWAGLRGEELVKETSAYVPDSSKPDESPYRPLISAGDAVFCHPGRFICGAQTRGDAVILAGLAIAS